MVRPSITFERNGNGFKIVVVGKKSIFGGRWSVTPDELLKLDLNEVGIVDCEVPEDFDWNKLKALLKC